MEHGEPPGSATRSDSLRVEYGEVCGTFRTLTDIRFKLLAFLPLAAGLTTAFAGDSLAERLVISAFGLAATIGLATYNSRNDQLYDELVGRAADIERQLGLAGGAFSHRPAAWLTLHAGPLAHRIDHRRGVAIIYGASFTLWTFGVFAAGLSILRDLGPPREPLFSDSAINLAALVLSLALVSAVAITLGRQKKARQDEMRIAAKTAVDKVGARPIAELDSDSAFVEACARLRGSGKVSIKAQESVCRRIGFYGGLSATELRRYIPDRSSREDACHLVALLTDMPPRWIEDCATGRRG